LQRFTRGNFVLKGSGLQHHAEALLHVAGPSSRVETRHRNLAIVRHTQSDDAFEQRRLAGAVWSQETEDLTFADLQRGAAHRLYVTVRFFQAANADDVCGGHFKKSQIPNPKSQIPSGLQVFRIGIWVLGFGFWDLLIVASTCLSGTAASAAPGPDPRQVSESA
jgi:hypothetical protein